MWRGVRWGRCIAASVTIFLLGIAIGWIAAWNSANGVFATAVMPAGRGLAGSWQLSFLYWIYYWPLDMVKTISFWIAPFVGGVLGATALTLIFVIVRNSLNGGLFAQGALFGVGVWAIAVLPALTLGLVREEILANPSEILWWSMGSLFEYLIYAFVIVSIYRAEVGREVTIRSRR